MNELEYRRLARDLHEIFVQITDGQGLSWDADLGDYTMNLEQLFHRILETMISNLRNADPRLNAVRLYVRCLGVDNNGKDILSHE